MRVVIGWLLLACYGGLLSVSAVDTITINPDGTNTFHVTGGSAGTGWTIGGQTNPTLNMTIGTTYTIAIDFATSGHPFGLNTASSSTMVAENGLVNAGNSCAGTAADGYTTASTCTLTFTPTAQTPQPLYYHCTAHTNMVGQILVNAAPTTATPTTAAPTTAEPTTAAPTTAEPTTAAPTTGAPTTAEPTTAEPTTAAPTTGAPTTAEPTTAAPTTAAPTTGAPTTAEPTTAAPTTVTPTNNTNNATTIPPTTATPTTVAPTNNTNNATTAPPTTTAPTTVAPTNNTNNGTTPTTATPTTATPTTPAPVTPVVGGTLVGSSFRVTGNTQASAYLFTGPNGTVYSNPTLNVTAGSTVTISLEYSTFHPLAFSNNSNPSVLPLLYDFPDVYQQYTLNSAANCNTTFSSQFKTVRMATTNITTPQPCVITIQVPTAAPILYYRCARHPAMIGTINVVAPASGSTTTAPPTATPTPKPNSSAPSTSVFGAGVAVMAALCTMLMA